MILLVSGTGRCGTHTVQELFEGAHNTIALHEGRGEVQGRYISLGDMKAINIYEGRLSRRREINLGRVKRKVFKGRKRLIRNKQSKNVVLVNRMNYRMIEYIYEKYDNVKIIHLIRNGYECVRSWYSRPGLYRGLGEVLIERIKNNTIGNLKSIYSYLWAFDEKENIAHMNKDNHVNYLLEKPIPSGVNRIRWILADRLEKTCWYWVFVNKYIEKEIENIPEEDKYILKIESLDRKESKKLSEFACIEGIAEFDFGNKRSKSEKEEIWKDKNVQKFKRICGDYMENMNYDIKK